MAIYASNVAATTDVVRSIIKLSWTNPTDSTFDHVVVFRRVDQWQTDPTTSGGVQVYSGTATTVYDYWSDSSYLPAGRPNMATTNYAQAANDVIGLSNDSNIDTKLLKDGQIYYYTVFAVDKSGNYYESPLTQVTARAFGDRGWGDRLWEMLPGYYQENDSLQNKDPGGLSRGSLQRLLVFLALYLNWTENKAKYFPYGISAERAEPWRLDYIAALLGWSVDKTQNVSIQRQVLLSAVQIYKAAGTRKGLDVLVKYYSGYPQTSGVVEGSSILLQAPLFGSNNQVWYLNDVCPDFGISDPASAPTVASAGSGTVGANIVSGTSYNYQIVLYEMNEYNVNKSYLTKPSPTATITAGTTPINISWTLPAANIGVMVFKNGSFLHDAGNATSYTDDGSLATQASPALSTSNTTAMDFANVGKGGDPLFYCYDFSPANKTGSTTFMAQVQATTTLTSAQQTSLQNRLKSILDQFVPAGVQYNINIYS